MRIASLLTALLLALCAFAADKTKVACVGNSITYGFLVDNREQNAYPFVLQRLLGTDSYEVGNFGRSRATLLEKGHFPYVQTPEHQAALDFKPDIVVIHLGVNDTDPRNWPNYNSEFVGDYIRLINRFKAANPDVRVLVALLSPLSAKHHRFRTGTRDWRLQAQQAIRQVAEATGAELIDFNAPLRDRQDLLPDGIHPNVAGQKILAETVYKAITGNYGGLSLSPVWQNSMVVQRNRPLIISGTADAGSTVTVTLDGVKTTARANNLGRWETITAPLVAGGPYTLQVTDGKTSISITDILAGEVWLASGQSNMEFHLDWEEGGADAVKNSSDPLLRVLNFTPVALTDGQTWNDSIRALTDANKYLTAGTWEKMNPENSGKISAVAYHFARQLRDSLNVPVGLIINAVGGANAESWTDVNALEAAMPEALVGWRQNDYVQPWCQERSRTNAGDHRHPYEPGYLFGAAIRPLGPVQLAGVLWYQGESNAHNIEIHEQLFPAMVESWRTHFRQPALPFVFAQLSSINRPSWPQFRNSQRLLAKSVPNTYMAVTYDLGDSLDVHPRQKQPVGERLARQALHHLYGFDNVTPGSPEPKNASIRGKRAVISFENADGLKATNSCALFELAGIDGVFHPAQIISIASNEITLESDAVASPRRVRYAWRPYIIPNIYNSDNLPLSTFEMETETQETLNEPGIEYGLSGLAAAFHGNTLITAGGCNFPDEPLAPASKKKFYEGIYAASKPFDTPARIGSLPRPMAYMASCQSGDKLYLLGGTSATEGLSDALELTLSSPAQVSTLTPLPFTFDNGAAAVSASSQLYIAGGNINGVPSRQVWTLVDGKWKKIAEMPGNPRVQPVMCIAKNADSQECLWIFGGFAPRHGKNEPSLELDGLCYNLVTKKWSKLPPLADSTGTPLSLGGGIACLLADGTIAMCGGVNKDIFLSALRNQPDDYLCHPTEWYKFNPNVIIFNPKTGEQSVAATSPDYARAGAAAAALPNGGFILAGGELRPRIRTSQTAIFK